jgi:hypothetical protein
MRYLAKFYGRLLNAIGKDYYIETIVEGRHVDDALLNLYQKFETVMLPTFMPLDHHLLFSKEEQVQPTEKKEEHND